MAKQFEACSNQNSIFAPILWKEESSLNEGANNNDRTQEDDGRLFSRPALDLVKESESNGEFQMPQVSKLFKGDEWKAQENDPKPISPYSELIIHVSL